MTSIEFLEDWLKKQGVILNPLIPQPRPVAYDPLQTDRQAEKRQIISKAALTLVDNLPPIEELRLNPNHQKEVLLQHLLDVAFLSSLKSDILWLHGGNGSQGVLKVKVGAMIIEIDQSNRALLDAAAAKLWDYSGVSKVLGSPTVQDFKSYLSISAEKYHRSQAKLKSSEYYLNELVLRASTAVLKYDKLTAKRADIAAALALVTAEIGISLGFKRDKRKNVNIDSSNNRFGSSELPEKVMLPYFKEIIERSTVSGRLNSSNDPANLLTAFINLLPL